jgi:hypothetical protein
MIMASKKTTAKSTKAKPAKKKAPAKKAAPKAKVAKKAEGEPKAAAPRHPKARLAALHGTKEALAKSLAESIAREDQDTSLIADRLKLASSAQLLRLHSVVTTVKEKYGSREKLIAAIGTAEKKSGDKDYLAMLDTLSLPNLLDLARSHERRARA